MWNWAHFVKAGIHLGSRILRSVLLQPLHIVDTFALLERATVRAPRSAFRSVAVFGRTQRGAQSVRGREQHTTFSVYVSRITLHARKNGVVGRKMFDFDRVVS